MGDESGWAEACFHRAWLPMARVGVRGLIIEGNVALAGLLACGVPELRGLDVRQVVAPGGAVAFAEQWRDLVGGRRSRCRGRVLVLRKDQRLVCADAAAWWGRAGPERREIVCSLNPVAGDGDGLTVPVAFRLSAVEARLLEGLAEGLSNAALGARLFLSKAGVDYYLARLRRKFRVGSRCGVVARAHALGVLVVAVWPPRIEAAYLEPQSGSE